MPSLTSWTAISVADSKSRNDDILKCDGELNPDSAEEMKILVKTGKIPL